MHIICKHDERTDMVHVPLERALGGHSGRCHPRRELVRRLLPRLCQLLRHHYEEGQQLIFVDTQESCDALFRELLKQNLPCATLHGSPMRFVVLLGSWCCTFTLATARGARVQSCRQRVWERCARLC